MKELQTFEADNSFWLGNTVEIILINLYNYIDKKTDYHETNLADILIDYPNDLNGD